MSIRLFTIPSLLLGMSLLTAQVQAEKPFLEYMQFMGPERSQFFRLPVGESIILTAGAKEEQKPELHGGETNLIQCDTITPTSLGSVRWQCTALRSGMERSELYFTVGTHKSRVLVIQTDPALDNTLPLPPSASFEDPILEDVTSFRSPFPDTVLWTPAGRAATELYRRDALSGFPPYGEFRGQLPVNRAEAAKILLSVRNKTVASVTANIHFSDVPADQWFTPYITAAAQEGIIFGYGDGTFRPDNTVTTAEFLAMTARTFDLPLQPEHTFSDVLTDDWFAAYAGIAQTYNLFPGRTDKLLPMQPLTRAEVTIAVYQYLAGRE